MTVVNVPDRPDRQYQIGDDQQRGNDFAVMKIQGLSILLWTLLVSPDLKTVKSLEQFPG